MNRYEKYKDSGVELIGEIPSHWELSRLKFISSKSVQYGINVGSEYYVDTGVRLIRTTDISPKGTLLTDGGVYVSPDVVESSDQFTTRGDILISRSGTLGRVYIHNTDDVHTFAGYLVRFHLDSPTKQMLVYYFLQSQFFMNWIETNSIVSTIGNINGQKYGNLSITLPPLPEQHQIVSFLDEKTSLIDDLINKKEQKIGLLKEYRTSLINRVITKGLNPDCPMKDSGVEWIGMIPSHWDVKRLRHCFRYKKGVNGQKLTKEYIGENPGLFPVYSGTTKGNGELGRTNEYEFDYDFKVLFTSTVGSDTTVMSTRIVSGRFNLSQNCLVMIPRIPVSVDYVHYYSTIDFQHRRNLLPVILKEGHRSVGMSDLDSYEVMFPPLSEQEQIVSFLDEKTGEIDRTIQSEQKKIELLKEYRQSLISSVITGKIKVVN